MILGRLSIRTRLTIAFAGALLLILVFGALFVYLRVSASLSGAIDDALRARADDLGVLVEVADPKELRSLARVPLPQESNKEGFFQILTPGGALAATTADPESGPALTPEQIERASREPIFIQSRVAGIEGEARVLGLPARNRDGPKFVVVAGISTDDRRETLRGLTGTFLIGAPLALLLAGGLGYLLAGRSLAPMEAMRRRADEITLERNGERMPLPRAEDEIHHLGETLNRMLDRIEGSLERERVFVADASHELRTPLAILSTELELAERPGRSLEDLRGAVGSAREEVDRLTQLAEDLLVLARSDRGQLAIARERVEPRVLLERVRTRFARRAAEHDREIVIDAASDSPAELDPFRVEQALANLVDNALRHGDGEVRLSARAEDGLIVFEVSDQGLGLPAGFEEEAFERFSRADPGRSGGGAGLGLSIVRAIAVAHGGQASVESTGDSTTTLHLTLPRQAPRKDL